MPLLPAGETPASASGHLSPGDCAPGLEQAPQCKPRSILRACGFAPHTQLSLQVPPSHCATHQHHSMISLAVAHPGHAKSCQLLLEGSQELVRTVADTGICLLRQPLVCLSLVILFFNIPKEKEMTVPICPRGVSKLGALAKPGINTTIPLSWLALVHVWGPSREQLELAMSCKDCLEVLTRMSNFAQSGEHEYFRKNDSFQLRKRCWCSCPGLILYQFNSHLLCCTNAKAG